jgi:hypothetical protein
MSCCLQSSTARLSQHKPVFSSRTASVGMEADRQWAFTAPPFASCVEQGSQATQATYHPAGWKRRKRRRDRKHGGGKRSKEQLVPAGQADKLAAASGWSASSAWPPNPTQLVPLRCTWPHPAVMDLVVQQCWPAAGPAALGTTLPAAAVAPAPYRPLQPSHNSFIDGSCGSASGAGLREAHDLPCPNVLVSYEASGRDVRRRHCFV